MNRNLMIYKYIFEQVGIKTKKKLIRDTAMFLEPETIDSLMGRSVGVHKDIYTGEIHTNDNYNQDKFTDWFFEQPSVDWNLLINSFFKDVPIDAFWNLISDAINYHSSDQNEIDAMIAEVNKLDTKLAEEERREKEKH